MNLSSLKTTLVVVSAIIPTILASTWNADLHWCSYNMDHPFVGDFNGDSRTDLLCHTVSNSYNWITIAFADDSGHFSGTRWKEHLLFCNVAGAELHIGDFNGDGKDDLLCHNTNDGSKQIIYANAAGNFHAGTTWQFAMGWCYHERAELHIGDFNGDGKDDMLCHDGYNGHKWISFANSNGNFEDAASWEAALWSCFHLTAELHIGDFNGDGRDDMLCHDSGNGYKWIAYANAAGYFTSGSDWEEGIEWCKKEFIGHRGRELHIGDANGDGKDDLFCHGTYRGDIRVALSNDQNNFHDGTSWELRAGLRWCYLDNRFFLGDYNGDSMTDMMCHDSRYGSVSVIYATRVPLYTYN